MPKKTIYGTPNEDFLDGTASTEDIIYGGDGDDHINGFDQDDVLYGEDGNDWLWGAQGNDILIGGKGDDRLSGVFGDDILSGGSGDDRLDGGEGADDLLGGSGSDTAIYNISDAVSISLLTGYAAGGDAEGDTLDSIENLVGSKHGDNLSGNNERNVIEGGGGEDAIFGFGGNDTLDGGSGDNDLYGGKGDDWLFGRYYEDELYGGEDNDWLSGGYSGDVINGGPGNDTVVYGDSNEAVTIDLSVALATGGFATGDTLSGIENVWGSDHDDKLSGDGGANTLWGSAGTDLLKGNGGADTFQFSHLQNELGRGADRILDFSQAEGYQIQMMKLYAGDFYFIGDDPFSGEAGELRYEHAGTNTWVSADIDGDAQADFEILCVGVINFTANDFIF